MRNSNTHRLEAYQPKNKKAPFLYPMDKSKAIASYLVQLVEEVHEGDEATALELIARADWMKALAADEVAGIREAPDSFPDFTFQDMESFKPTLIAEHANAMAFAVAEYPFKCYHLSRLVAAFWARIAVKVAQCEAIEEREL